MKIDWLQDVHFDRPLPAECRRAVDLLGVGVAIHKRERAANGQSPLSAPVLIIGGGAASVDAGAVSRIRPVLATALADFRGTFISGGRTMGVPGCVGRIAGRLAGQIASTSA